MEAIILVLLMILPLGFVYYKTKKKTVHETRSLKTFVCAAPVFFPAIFEICGFVFSGLMLFVYFYNGFGFNSFEVEFLYMGLVFSIICTILSFCLCNHSMSVSENDIMYTTILGRVKEAKFSDITKVTLTDARSLVIYINGKKLGKLERNYLHLDNLEKRLKKEGISITLANNSTMTKFSLYLASIKMILWIAGIMFIGLTILFIFVGKDIKTILDVTFVALLLALSIVLMASLLPQVGIINITRQEMALSFSFKEEMKQCGGTGSKFVNRDWFIDTDQTHVVAYRRDYINNLSEIIHPNVSAMNASIYIYNCNGKRVKVTSYIGVIESFKYWYENTYEEASLV